MRRLIAVLASLSALALAAPAMAYNVFDGKVKGPSVVTPGKVVVFHVAGLNPGDRVQLSLIGANHGPGSRPKRSMPVVADDGTLVEKFRWPLAGRTRGVGPKKPWPHTVMVAVCTFRPPDQPLTQSNCHGKNVTVRRRSA